MNMKEFYEDYMAAEEKAKACKCCNNCRHCITDYGYIECAKEEMPEDADTGVFHCDKWSFGY